jgi:hypothetical protein
MPGESEQQQPAYGSYRLSHDDKRYSEAAQNPALNVV